MKIIIQIFVAIIALVVLFKILWPFFMAMLGAYLFLKYTVPLLIIILLLLGVRRMFKKNK